MTMKDFLAGNDVAKLEAMTDEELLGYMAPFLAPKQAAPPAKSSNVIDVSGTPERKKITKENLNEYLARVQAIMKQKLDTAT